MFEVRSFLSSRWIYNELVHLFWHASILEFDSVSVLFAPKLTAAFQFSGNDISSDLASLWLRSPYS